MDVPAAAKRGTAGLASHLEDIRSRSHVGKHSVSYPSSFDSSGAFRSQDVDHSFAFEDFAKNFEVSVKHKTDTDLVFDLIGIDAPVANAFRRIMISEVPTMAFETLNIFNNTSIIQDEVLAHRIGLIPIKVDPRQFQMKGDGDESEDNALVFELKAACTRNPDAGPDATHGELYNFGNVYARDLKWVPMGKQAAKFADCAPCATNPDILIAKLKPGQEIDMELHVEKGIGRDHAKWSPVATASYRLLPEVRLTKVVDGEMADELVKMCPSVFDIATIDGVRQAVVAKDRERECTMSRNSIREDKWADIIKLFKVKDHFIFSIESTGALSPQDIFTEALQILIAKAVTVDSRLREVTQSLDPLADVASKERKKKKAPK